jgi:hypothetical protein
MGKPNSKKEEKLLEALLQAPSYRRADKDPDFLGRGELRLISQ